MKPPAAGMAIGTAVPVLVAAEEAELATELPALLADDPTAEILLLTLLIPELMDEAREPVADGRLDVRDAP
jgi:hypothetical protein